MFTSIPLVACWRYEPREHPSPLAMTRVAIPPSPLRDRVGYSDHVRFRGYLPVHLIPACNLPVYASQRPLPDATQDSVHGRSLGFAVTVISDGADFNALPRRNSHTTVRTAPYTAVREVTLTRFDQGRETERFEVGIGEPDREGFTPGEMPGATAAAGRIAQLPRDSQRDECRSATPWCFPLTP